MTAIAAAALALGVTAIAGFGARWLGLATGALDFPTGRLKPHPHPVSYLGGLAVAAGVAAGLVARAWPLPWFLTVALFGITLVGLSDDVLGFPPVVRLAAQVGLGVLVAANGLDLPPLGPVLGWIAAVVFFAGAVNAANMVDGMDGLAGTAAALSGIGLAVVGAMADKGTLLPLLIAGASIGFLVHNRPPARLFLGNSGSYLLGATLAVSVLLVARGPALMVGAGTCLGLFALDLLLSVARRVAGRSALLEPDREHLYDQLLGRGFSVVECLVISAVVHAMLVGAGIGISRMPSGLAITVAAVVWLAALAALIALGFVGRRARY